MTAIHFITARQTVRSSDQWRKTMRNRARLFILLALAPIIIGLAGFDSNAEARHRRYYGGGFYGAGFNRFGPCCQAPCPVAGPGPCDFVSGPGSCDFVSGPGSCDFVSGPGSCCHVSGPGPGSFVSDVSVTQL